jgi:hypothetical protein
MILEEETHKKFGDYPSDFALRSHKKILAACDDCGKVRETTKGHYRALCRSCAHKGKLHTKATRRKIGISRIGKTISEDTRRKMCIAQKGLMSREKHPNWKGGPIERKCKTCGKAFSAKPCDIKRGQGVFCSCECYIKSNLGGNNPNWKGGASFEPYCYKFNEQFKQYIRAKFGNVCFLCSKTEEENGKALSVHHVNYDKECGCAETEEDKEEEDKACQFVPLCVSCNSKVNFNRDFWERRIKDKMRNKLNGWYI